MAAAIIELVYSAGLCSVYSISLRAISKMTAVLFLLRQLAKIASAVSNVNPRTLIAGTVSPSHSPLPAAMYKSLIEARITPSS
ncbi:MAG: hypothetical protein BWY28_01510 [bacterium ADurb.Bin236]|nr:MAG: hypothetical protein BWY28_01510 [bacterium ADurb.Bin236]